MKNHITNTQVSSLNSIPITHGSELCMKYYCMGWRLYHPDLCPLLKTTGQKAEANCLGHSPAPSKEVLLYSSNL